MGLYYAIPCKNPNEFTKTFQKTKLHCILTTKEGCRFEHIVCLPGCPLPALECQKDNYEIILLKKYT